MKNQLTREQIVDLLYYIGSAKVINKEGKSDIQFCCTIHGESNPSAGFSLEKMCFNCFSCHASGGVEWLVMKSMPEDFKSVYDVDKFIKSRYNVDLSSVDISQVKELRRYGEKSVKQDKKYDKRVLPKSYLAPFKSGKETYKYFYDRGFTKETVEKFKIGRDLVSKTVTVPVFYDNETELAGVIGRYIDPNRRKNERYKIYEDTNTGTFVFPQDKCKTIDGTLIVVEGLLDAVYMHQLGYTNTFATLTNSISNAQVDWVKRQGASKILDMTDNDEMGKIATDIINKKLGKYLKVVTIKHLFPEDCKDPQDMTPEQVAEVITKATTNAPRKLLRRR